jgi:hypothetical protein
MKRLGMVLGLFAMAALLPTGLTAQTDAHGKPDTVYADLSRVDGSSWIITISYTNDEIIEGMTVPIRMTAGLTRIVADSAVYTGGRADHFALKAFRPDTAIQSFLLGLVANLAPTTHQLDPGRGRLATVFVSSIDDKPIDSLVVDTTTLPPHSQRLMAVAKTVQGVPPDTVSIDRDSLKIMPAFVVRYLK